MSEENQQRRRIDENDTDRVQPQVGPDKPGDSPSEDPDVQADRDKDDKLPR